jgi:hypothetical protein
MEYSPEEWSWIEAEWAFHCFGRTAFISPEDFRQAKVWEEQGVPSDVIVSAMGAFFDRRAKRPRPRAFVTLSHLKKDVEKTTALRKALSRAGAAAKADLMAWDKALEPLKSDPKARKAFEAWMRVKCNAPSPESPGFIDHLDSERKVYRVFVEIAAKALGPLRAELEARLAEKLLAVDIAEGSVVWRRAWDHHFAKDVCSAWGLEGV